MQWSVVARTTSAVQTIPYPISSSNGGYTQVPIVMCMSEYNNNTGYLCHVNSRTKDNVKVGMEMFTNVGSITNYMILAIGY